MRREGRAVFFWSRKTEAAGRFYSRAENRGAVECSSAEQPWSVFLESRKQRRAGVIFPGAENLQQQFLLQQNSQICMQIG